MEIGRHTFLDEYKECVITILALRRDHDSAWTVGVSITTSDGFSLPVIQDDDACYKDIALAHAAGVALGRALVDDELE